MRSSVVLPHPDGPSSTRNSPSRIERSTSSTAWSCPKLLLRCRISTPAIGRGRSPVAVPREADAIRFHHHHVDIASQGSLRPRHSCTISGMKPLPAMTRESFQILIVRELRKVGFDVGTVRTHRRSELPEPERGFVLELVIPLRCAGATWRALIVCLHQLGVVAPDVIASAKARLADASADVVIIFATAEFA